MQPAETFVHDNVSTYDIELIATLLQDAISQNGYGNNRFELIRVCINAVYQNTIDGIVARVSPPDISLPKIQQNLHMIIASVADGAPFLLPLTETTPILLPHGFIATLWPLGKPSHRIEPDVIAALASACHSTPIRKGIPEWKFDHYTSRINRSLSVIEQTHIPTSYLKFLISETSHCLQRLQDIWDQVDVGAHMSLLHGDLYPGNAIEYDEQTYLIDCDHICIGPVEFDLAQMAVEYNRADPTHTVEELVSAYDKPIDMALLDGFTNLRQINRCLWYASQWNNRADCRQEISHRIENWHDVNALWTVL